MPDSLRGRLLGGLRNPLTARGPEVQSFASRYGLRYDPYRSKPYRVGGGRLRVIREQNELTGRWRDLPVREVDRKISTDTPAPHLPTHPGSPVHTAHHVKSNYVSHVQADLAAVLPGLAIRSRVLMARLDSGPSPFPHDVHCGSAEFNRVFEVTTADTAFATKLIDASMIDWLLSTGPEFMFVLLGGNLVVTCSLLPISDLARIFDAAKNFTDRIPHQIWIDYGTG